MGNHRVLVVEDDSLLSWALAKAISACRCPVQVAGTEAEALQSLGGDPFELAFLDVHLPDGSGIEILSRIRATSPATKVVVLSSDVSDTVRQRVSEGGAWQFLEKPFDLSVVARLVKACFGDPAEVRREDRHFCRLPLRIVLLETDPQLGEAELRQTDGTAVDIASRGMRLVTGYPLRPGQWVRAAVTTPRAPYAEFVRRDVPAEVVWVRPEQDQFTVGLRYP